MNKKNSRKRGILVVDDNHHQRRALVGMLGMRGYRCYDVATGETAVRLIEQHKNIIHACLLDLQLSGSELSGIETLRKINQIDPALPILAFSAFDQAEISDAVAAGATLFISKQNIDTTSLIVSLDALVKMRGLTQDVLRRQKAARLLHEVMEYIDCKPQKLTEYVAGFLHEQLGFKRVRIYLLNDENRLIGVAARGMGDEFDITQYFAEDDSENALNCFKDDTPVIITGDQLIRDHRYQTFRKDGVKNELQVPLVSASGKVGLIMLDDRKSERQIFPEDVALTSLVSVTIASAVNVCKRRKVDDRKRAWFQALADFDDALAKASSVNEVLSLMIDTLRKFFEADSGVILTKIPNDKGLQMAAASGNIPFDIEGIHPGTYGLIGQCYQEGRQVYEPDTQMNEIFQKCIRKIKKIPALYEYFSKTRTALAQPIKCGDSHTIGVLYLQFLKLTKVPELDRSFLDSVARRIAIALAKLDEAQRVEAAVIQQAKLNDLVCLTAGVAHGIRNPLVVIQSAAESAIGQLTIEQDCNTQAVLFATTLEQTIQQVQRALATLDRLMDWARPRGAESTLINMKDLLEDLIELVREEFRDDRNILIKRDFTDESCLVYAVSDALRMALADLFWNAARHMSKGGTLTIDLRHLSSDSLQLSISDTGTGMSDEKVKGLFSFSPFEPIESGGSGLGLYLCRKVIDSINGRIWCESTLGKGTSIFIVIPLATPKHNREHYE